MKFLYHPWVDSVYKSLSQEERIGQLILVKADPGEDIGQEVWLDAEVKKFHLGGILFSEDFSFTGQKRIIDYFRRVSDIPLLFAEDNTMGPGLNLVGALPFPHMTTMEALRDDSLFYRLGEVLAEEFKRAGINMSLVIHPFTKENKEDIPIKNDLFKYDRGTANNRALFYMNGLMDNGILFSNGTDCSADLMFHKDSCDSDSINSSGFIFLSDDPDKTISSIEACIKEGLISKDSINKKCRMVLAVKYWAVACRNQRISENKTEEEIASGSIKALVRDLYANALTVLTNKEEIIPVKDLGAKRIASISFNDHDFGLFRKRLSDYMPVSNFIVDLSDTMTSEKVLKELSSYDLVITGLNYYDPVIKEVSDVSEFLSRMTDANRTVITWFGDPAGIAKEQFFTKAYGLILAYQDNEFTEDLAAQLIFGGIGGNGVLPFSLNTNWPEGSGLVTQGNQRLQYGFPENAGLSSKLLSQKVDSIVNIGLDVKAYPGCEVMIARKGIVVFHKTYGFHTYDKRIPVVEDNLFDLASVTKISSTLAGLMLLDSQGKFSLDKRLGDYLAYFRKSNKENLQMKDLLTHQAGMKAWIPFWQETIRTDSSFKRNVFRSEPSRKFPLKVASNLYINKNYRKKMFREIKESPVGEKKYVYSDLTFIISPGIIEFLTGEKWYDFVTNNIYHKIGAFDIGFNPGLKYPLPRIVPTEYDSIFRKQLIHGTVHDEAAAMLGGISGHAGLFATANDLMKLMELYRRMGSYGGENIIGRDVLEKYSKVQFPENNNRRGLGFDKPLLNNADLTISDAYPARSASSESFGHTGFTGTMVWIDPTYEITYVFLCNRVYPTRNNNRLSDLNIRSSILQAVYDSIIDSGLKAHYTR